MSDAELGAIVIELFHKGCLIKLDSNPLNEVYIRVIQFGSNKPTCGRYEGWHKDLASAILGAKKHIDSESAEDKFVE